MLKNKRQEEILNTFVDGKKELTAEEIGTCLGVCSRTIRNDIKEINYSLNNSGAEIIMQKGKGYKLRVYNSNDFKMLLDKFRKSGMDLNLSSDERIKYILTKLLINELHNDGNVILSKLANEMYISISTLKNDIKLLKIHLVKNSLSIKKLGRNGIKIIGTEENLRKAFNEMIFIRHDESIEKGIFVIKNKYMQKGIEDEADNRGLLRPNELLIKSFKDIVFIHHKGHRPLRVREILRRIINFYDLDVNDKDYEELVCYLSVFIIRNIKGKRVKLENNKIEELKKNPGYHIGLILCKEIEKQYDVKFEDEEVAYLARFILSTSIRLKEKEVKINNSMFVEKILLNLKEVFGITIVDDEVLKQSFYEKMYTFIYRAQVNIQVQNKMLPIIKNKFPYSFEVSVYIYKLVRKELGINLMESDLGVLALYIELALEKNWILEKKKILLFCSDGYDVAQFLKNKLEIIFKNQVLIKYVKAFYELSENILNDIQLIISTEHIKSDTKEVILIKNLLDYEEVEVIKNYIEKKELLQYSLLEKLKDELIFRYNNIVDKNTLLKKMAEDIYKQGYLNEDIGELLLQREEISTTENSNLVAIPRIFGEKVINTFVSIGILDNPILWHDKRIKVVIIIGVKNNNKEFQSLLYKGCSIMNHKKLIDKIIKTTSYNEIQEAIKEYI